MKCTQCTKARRSNDAISYELQWHSQLPNVRQAYSLVLQDETQRQVTLTSIWSTKNFSIVAAIHSKSNNISNNFTNKHWALW